MIGICHQCKGLIDRYPHSDDEANAPCPHCGCYLIWWINIGVFGQPNKWVLIDMHEPHKVIRETNERPAMDHRQWVEVKENRWRLM
jgi:hypothetical protein